MKKRENNLVHTISQIVIIVGVVIVYAIGLQVTQIDLKEPQKEKRQEQLTNILRGLARPDLFAFETERVEVNAPILVPCPGQGPDIPPVHPGEPTITLSKNCAEPGETITISGSNFQGGESVFIYFVPFAEDAVNEVNLKLADSAVRTGIDGTFSEEVSLKRDRDSDQAQTVRAVVNRRSGLPRPSEALIQTVDKIIETIFLALLATTLGVFLAVPFSFLAARNLMLEVRTSFSKLMAALILILIGGFIGFLLLGAVYDLPVTGNIIAAIEAPFAGLGFAGNFLVVVTDTLFLSIPPLGALVGAVALNSAGGRIVRAFLDHGPRTITKIASIILAALAGAILFSFILAGVNWFYQLGQVPQVLIVPALIGAVIFALLGVFFTPDRPIPSGMFIYYSVRTVMNIFRSIEPLLMVVAFAVWVGIGPFAGVMALTLHTVVALGKLYSEQVENISTGPIEAVTSTGANRLQTIIYAVIPQIVPPYIAFTVYRWDINVRMSTIIGFGGGGGIGFLLAQNVNLLKYRQASVNMIAIAIVVTSLDYISAKVRERIT